MAALGVCAMPAAIAMDAPSAAHDDPRVLVARLREGDLDALAVAYDRHGGAVLAFARRLLGEEASAQDLLHEVFLTLPHAIRSFRGDSSLQTFLVSIAVNHARHHVRSAVRRRAMLERYGREPEATGRTPEHEAERADLARHLSECLDALPLDQRVAFVLCEVEERSAAEAAAIVGAPEATVRTRAFHARRKLRELLAERGLR